MTRLQKGTDVTRRAARLVQLAKRLESQMKELEQSRNRDRALAEAALLLSEIGEPTWQDPHQF
jgi:molybdenum-dependent DNA-binding transcriptional regulator ModE